MRNRIITATMIASSFLAYGNNKLSVEEHANQAMVQMQESQIKFSRGSTIVTVGNDVTCDFRLGDTRIQDAIDSGADIVRIASDSYIENLVISDVSIEIEGGYDTCTDAINDVSNGSRQLISGSGNDAPTILITGSTQRNTVNLSSLDLRFGEGVGFSPGGGISTVVADLALTLDQISMINNTSNVGGGLAIFEGDTDTVLIDPNIFNNTAEEGGGIYCEGSGASVLVFDSGSNANGIFSNTANNGDGGAVLVTSGCNFSTLSGKEVGAFDFRGIFANMAIGNGGGIAARNGATVNLFGGIACAIFCIGNNDNPVNVNGNTADSDNDGDGFGGGVYATGTNTTVNVTNAYITANSAQSGGGITVENEATLTMQSLYSFGNCWNPGSCNQLKENETATEGGTVRRGGGLYATTGADINISNTLIKDNRADFGTAIYVISAVADPVVTNLDMEGSLVVNNGDNGADGWDDIDAIRIIRADAKLDFNTIADNDLGGATSTIIENTGDLSLYSSIIHNTDATSVYDGSGTLDQDCLMVHETASLPASAQTFLDDPEFIDRVNGNYHLDPTTSPAIDFCDTFFTSPDFNDSDNEPRGFDDPLATDNLGPYDVGFDETYANDIIFDNGFEAP